MSFLVPKSSQHGSTRSVSNFAGPSTQDVNAKGDDITSDPSSSVIHFYPEGCHCSPCLVKKKYRRKDNASCWVLCKNAFLCPPSGALSRCIYFFMANGLFWIFSWCLDKYLAQDTISALIFLEITGLTFGVALKLCGLPALLAPLIIGIALNNVPRLKFFHGLHSRDWIGPIRTTALTIILTRAGIELSPKQLSKLKGIVPMAAFGPCVVEAITCAVLFWLFFKEQWAICFVAGFSLAAVSPAVVVPGMLSLKKKHYGTQSGIPTLLIAASSIDDVLAISCFSISMSFVDKPEKHKKEHWKTYAGLVGVPVGIVHGLILGIILHFIPSKDMGHKNIPYLRTLLLLLLNVCTIFSYEHEETEWLSGAGSVGVLVTSFIASFGWRSVPHWKPGMNIVENTLALIWTLMVPMLFGTIGNEISIKEFDWNVVGKIAAIIGISLVIRLTTMFIITCCIKNATCAERVFCSLTWIPKATVQATLAPLVTSTFEHLDIKNPKTKELQDTGKKVVLLAVLGILITAPLGAIIIGLCGKRMLRRASQVVDEFPNGEGEPEDENKEVHIILNAGSDDFSEGVREDEDKNKTNGSDIHEPLPLTSPVKKTGSLQGVLKIKANSV